MPSSSVVYPGPLNPWTGRQYVLPKRRERLIQWHSVTFQPSAELFFSGLGGLQTLPHSNHSQLIRCHYYVFHYACLAPSRHLYSLMSQRSGCEFELPVCCNRKSPMCRQFVFVAFLTASSLHSDSTHHQTWHQKQNTSTRSSDGRITLQQTVQGEELIPSDSGALLWARSRTIGFLKLRGIYMVKWLSFWRRNVRERTAQSL